MYEFDFEVESRCLKEALSLVDATFVINFSTQVGKLGTFDLPDAIWTNDGITNTPGDCSFVHRLKTPPSMLTMNALNDLELFTDDFNLIG